jgi:hypothetical protein
MIRVLLLMLLGFAIFPIFSQDYTDLAIRQSSKVTCIKSSSNSKFVVIQDIEGDLGIWDLQTNELKKELIGHSSPVLDISISTDNKLIATGSGDKKIILWDSDGNKQKTIETGSYVKSLRFVKNNQTIVSAQWDGTIRFWDIKSGALIHTLYAHPQFSWNLDVSQDNNFAVTTGFDDEIKIWDLQNYTLSKSITSTITYINSCLLIPNSKNIAVLGNDSTIRVLDWEAGKEKVFFKDSSSSIISIKVNSTGDILFSAHSNGIVKVWDIQTGDCINTIKHGTRSNENLNLTAFDFASNANQLYICIDNYGLYTLGFNNILPLKFFLKNEIKKELDQWLKKDEFEKNASYLNRVNDNNKNLQLKLIESKILQNEGQKLVRENVFSILEFDAETEIYHLNSSKFGEFAVKVPLKFAPVFKKEFKGGAFLISEYGFDGIQIRFSKIAVKIKDNTFDFDNNSLPVYQPYNFLNEVLVSPSNLAGQTKSNSRKIMPNLKPTGFSPVDINIPEFNAYNKNAIAIVIGNKDYLNTQSVDFALNDARIMKKYLINSLGYKEGNVLLYENISLDEFNTLFGTANSNSSKLKSLVKSDLQDVFIYYSGHGAPGINNSKGYFVPVACDPNFVENGGYSIDLFYKNLSNLNARSINVVIDACFSGADILKNISPIGIKIIEPTLLIENLSVITSSSASEISSWYPDMKHGLFTYFFLKSIQNYKETDLNRDMKLSMNEIYMKLSSSSDGVNYHARLINGVQQTPTLLGTNGNNTILDFNK